MNIQESGQMYLETILILTLEKKNVRSIDVAEYMNFSKPSVSRAMGLLKKDSYIVMDHSGNILLTESGRQLAEKIYERHSVLTKMLKNLGVSDQTAAEDACKIEHDISDETFEAIKKHFSNHNE